MHLRVLKAPSLVGDHRHLERYGQDAERMRRILDGKGGEPLTAFAWHVAALSAG